MHYFKYLEIRFRADQPKEINRSRKASFKEIALLHKKIVLLRKSVQIDAEMNF